MTVAATLLAILGSLVRFNNDVIEKGRKGLIVDCSEGAGPQEITTPEPRFFFYSNSRL